VTDIRFRVTVSDLDRARQYYRDTLGITVPPGSFSASPGVMAMMGLPGTVEYRLGMTPIPGSTLILELLEFKGIERAAPRRRVQDPGAYRLQLTVDDLDTTLRAVQNGGSRPLSKTGAAVRMTFDGPWRLAAVPDPNGIFLVLMQGPRP
jgi:predicted enzyme related to lactoylglutathione lyase